jgi:hypothetical protein
MLCIGEGGCSVWCFEALGGNFFGERLMSDDGFWTLALLFRFFRRSVYQGPNVHTFSSNRILNLNSAVIEQVTRNASVITKDSNGRRKGCHRPVDPSSIIRYAMQCSNMPSWYQYIFSDILHHPHFPFS